MSKGPVKSPGALGAILWAGLWLAPGEAEGGGPLIFDPEGQTVGWSTERPVSYYIDGGSLGRYTSQQAGQLVQSLFSAWNSVPTASISGQPAGYLEVDVDTTNFLPFLGPFVENGSPVGRSVIVFDASGEIFDLLYGTGSGILGFASPTYVAAGQDTFPVTGSVPVGSRIVEGMAFLNGIWVDGIDDPAAGNFELRNEDFEAVFIHEFGHFLGLDHTQIHGYSDYLSEARIETMYSFLLTFSDQRTLEQDDRVAISALYPETGFHETTGRFEGRILAADGTPLTGFNVIARSVGDPNDAVSYVSGATLVPPGRFVLAGLTPGRAYRIEVQEIDVFARDGSGVGPFPAPAVLPGPPEYFSGGDESADPSIDPRCSFINVFPQAGATTGGMDIVLNEQRMRVINDVPLPSLQDAELQDFDGDGILDMVDLIIREDEDGLHSVTEFRRGLGSGDFGLPEIIDLFQGSFAVISGQFNPQTDQYPDLAVAGRLSAEVRVYHGQGAGRFGAPTVVMDAPDFPQSILDRYLFPGDFNNDGLDDMALFLIDEESFITQHKEVRTLLANGDGTFALVITPLPPLTTSLALAPARINGDPVPDFIGCDFGGLNLFTGDGKGGFNLSYHPLADLSYQIWSLGVGDFDRNGYSDVAVSDLYPVEAQYDRCLGTQRNSSFVDVLLNQGTGQFRFTSRYQVPHQVQQGFACADFDGDGHLDIASTAAYYGIGDPGASLNIGFGDGAGGIRHTLEVWGLTEFPDKLLTGDLDGNRLPDLLIAHSSSSFLAPDAGSRGATLALNFISPLPRWTVSTDAIEFGTVTVGDTASASFSVSNVGNAELTIRSVDLPPETRIVPPAPVAVSPRRTLPFSVFLEPTRAQPAASHIVLRSNDPENPRAQIITTGDVRLLRFSTRTLTPSPAALGEAVTLLITPEQGVRIESGRVRYRPRGDAAAVWQDGLLYRSGSQWFARIPGADVTEDGLEYYVEVSNSGVSATDPGNAPSTLFTLPVAPPDGILAEARPTSGDRFLEDRDIPVLATIPRGAVVRSAVLYFRRGGESRYESDSLRATGSGLAGTIPRAFVTSRGVEFRVEVQTASTLLTDPPVEPARHPRSLRVSLSESGENEEWPGNVFRMVSLPIEFEGEPASLDESVLTAGDPFPSPPSKWSAFFHPPDGGEYRRYSPETRLTDFQLLPGRAFWLTSGDISRIKTIHPGLSVRTDQYYEILLSPGFNQVGNPFPFPVSWNQVRVGSIPVPESPDVEAPREWLPVQAHYNDPILDPVTILKPFGGVFVRNGSGTPLMLRIPAMERAPADSQADSSAKTIDAAWLIEIAGRAGDLKDPGNYVGVETGASSGWDRRDLSDPPAIPGEALSVYFPHLQWTDRPGYYSVDIRNDETPDPAASARGHVFDFDVVRTSAAAAAGEELGLSFGGLDDLPEDFDSFLIDRNLMRVEDLNRRPEYSFFEAKRERVTRDSESRFALVLGTPEFIASSGVLPGPPGVTRFLPASPNPFRTRTLILFDIAAAGKADLEVFDVQGRLVAVLEERNLTPGRYEVAWDGRDDRGRPVGPGVYFIGLRTAGLRTHLKVTRF